jgi:anti-sigma factor RsiW
MQEMTHLTDETLEAYCDGALDAGRQASVETHVFRCGRCRVELDEWRSLFSMLAALPRFAPSAEFADFVMAKVRIPEPWRVRAFALARRFVPKTTPAWAFTVALLAVPLLAIGTLAVWLFSRSYLTGYQLWVFATDQFAAGASSAASGAFSRVVQTDVTVWLVSTVTTFLDSVGLRGAGAMAAATGGVILVSIWVLYRFLFRTSNRGAGHVSFMF